MRPHVCDHDECAPANVNGPKRQCAKCMNTYFLMCFGFVLSVMGNIILKLPNGVYMEVDAAKLVAFICPACSNIKQQKTPPSANKQQKKQTPKSTRQSNITQFTSSAADSQKLDQILAKLSNVEDDFKAFNNDNKEFQTAIKSHMTKTMFSDASMVATPKNRSNFMDTPNTSNSAKRKRNNNENNDLDKTPKSAFKARKLTSGTATNADHGLG